MSNALLGLTLIGTMVGLILFGAVIGTAAGAFAGWMVGLFFSNTINTAMVAFGFQPLAVWKLGAFLGFVGSFFVLHKQITISERMIIL